MLHKIGASCQLSLVMIPFYCLPSTTPLTHSPSSLPSPHFSLSLHSTEHPDPPTNLTVDSITSDQVSLSWFPNAFDGNRPVLQYIVLQRNRSDVNDTADFVMVNIQPVDALTMHSGKVTYSVSQGLVPFSLYDFAVQVCNEQGCSELSSPSLVVKTLQACESI